MTMAPSRASRTIPNVHDAPSGDQRMGSNMPVRPLSVRWPVLLLGAMVAGWLDITFAAIFWGLRGVPTARVLQSVASGALGRDAFAGGVGTAVLGLVLHLAIASLMVLAYDRAALRLRWLVGRPWLAGPLYGLVLYLVMTYVVVPLSAAAQVNGPRSWIVAGVLSHMLLVGLPCALFVRAAQAPVVAKAGGGDSGAH
jgi:hypothetical protein